MQDIKNEYAELRESYLAGQKDKSFASLMKCRAKRRQVSDWSAVSITKPTFLGTRVLDNYDIKRVVPYIDWDPFFQTW